MDCVIHGQFGQRLERSPESQSSDHGHGAKGIHDEVVLYDIMMLYDVVYMFRIFGIWHLDFQGFSSETGEHLQVVPSADVS